MITTIIQFHPIYNISDATFLTFPVREGKAFVFIRRLNYIDSQSTINRGKNDDKS